MRRVLTRLALVMGVTVFAVAAAVLFVREYRQASSEWIQFSIAPPSGESASISPTAIRADGLTLKAALATAYDMPAVRIVGPASLLDTRYSINASLPADAVARFRPLLQQELTKRLALETHFEVRPYDVFVLAATEAPRLDRAAGPGPSTWISKKDVRMRGVSMADVASALQGLLGRPVVDETGTRGAYDMQFEWEGERLPSVTATLRDRFGLRLSPATRNLETLIVDRIRRDPALVIVDQVGRLTRAAPAKVRRSIADVVRTY